MKKFYRAISTLLIFVASIVEIKAQLIQAYNFVGAAGSEVTLPPDGQPQNGIFGNIRRGSGLINNAGLGTFSAAGFTQAAAKDTGDYFEFAVKANTNYKINLDSLVLAERRSNTGIRTWEIWSSRDNFQTSGILQKTFNVEDDNLTRKNQKIPFGTSLMNVPATETVTFRFYGYAAEGETGTWRLDSIRVFGQIVSAISGPPSLSFSKITDTIPELLGVGSVVVQLSQVQTQDVSFTIQTQPGATLSPNEISVNGPGPFVIPAGQTAFNIQYNNTGLDDALFETDESVSFKISMISTGIQLGIDSVFTLVVRDDDAPFELYQFKSKTATVREGATANIKIRLHATSKLPPGGMVEIAIKGGSAFMADYSTTQIGPIPVTTDSILNLAIFAVFDGLAEGNADSLILVLRPVNPPGTGGVYLGSDSIFILKFTDSVLVILAGPPTRTIAQIKGNSTGNQADSVGKSFRIYGTVYGLNTALTPATAGYNMHLRDATGGIGIFKNAKLPNVPVLNEGDSIKIMGKIVVFRGQSQINPDSIVILATGRSLKTPKVVLKPTEAEESDLVRINGVQLVDPTKWTTGVGNGGFTVRVYNGTDTTDVRIDNDGPLYTAPAPVGTFDVIGMGGQFVTGSPTPVAPFPATGYQITPRRLTDIIPVVSVDPLCNCETQVNVYPNPGSEELILENKAKGELSFQIFNGLGKNMINISKPEEFQKVDTKFWPSGIYYIKIVETGKSIGWMKK